MKRDTRYRQGEAAGMAQHVRVDREGEGGHEAANLPAGEVFSVVHHFVESRS